MPFDPERFKQIKTQTLEKPVFKSERLRRIKKEKPTIIEKARPAISGLRKFRPPSLKDIVTLGQTAMFREPYLSLLTTPKAAEMALGKKPSELIEEKLLPKDWRKGLSRKAQIAKETAMRSLADIADIQATPAIHLIPPLVKPVSTGLGIAFPKAARFMAKPRYVTKVTKAIKFPAERYTLTRADVIKIQRGVAQHGDVALDELSRNMPNYAEVAKQAMKTGKAEIEIPEATINALVDRPWFATFKSIIGKPKQVIRPPIREAKIRPIVEKPKLIELKPKAPVKILKAAKGFYRISYADGTSEYKSLSQKVALKIRKQIKIPTYPKKIVPPKIEKPIIAKIKITPETKSSPEEAGFVAIPAKEDFIKGVSQLTAKIDIEKPFIDIGAKQTGFAIKNYYTRREAERERARDIIGKLSKLKLSLPEYIEATYVAAQPTLFVKYPKEFRTKISPAYQMARNYFDTYAKKLQELEVIADPWPQSLISRLQSENLHYKEAIKIARNKEALQTKIDNNNAIIDFLKRHKIQYVHLPLRVWLEDLFQKAPDRAPRILSRFFQKRETVDIRALAQTLLKEGIIKPEDVDIRSIIASYSNKVGRTIALSEIFLNAKKEGLVKSLETAPETWVSPPARLVPELKGNKVHPAFMNYLENFLQSVSPAYRISRPLGYIKILAFDNPFFLGGYNIEQGFWAGSFRSIKTPIHFVNAVKSILKRDEHYWNAFENGLFSKPYLPPFENFQKEVELLKETTFLKRALKWIQQNSKMPLDIVYKPLWNIAWNFSDKYPRMTTYHYLLNKGLSPHDSAQLGAYFHGDYASLPPGTRKIINKIWFTPTFKIIMSKLHLSMIKSAGKTIANAAQLKPSNKKDQILATGLLALMALEYGRRKMMKSFGFKEEDFALRYVKEIDTPEGKREIVIYMPTAGNIWLRYYHRWNTFLDDPNKLEGFLNRAKWDLHPLYRTSIMWLQNRKANGEPIYNPFDDKGVIALDSARFFAKDIIAVLDRFPDEREEERQAQAYKALRKDLGIMYPLFQILSPTKLPYLRKPEVRRKEYRANILYKEYRKFIFADPPKTAQERKARIDNFKRRLHYILER